MRLGKAMVGPHGGSARLRSEWAGAYLHVTLEAQLAQLRHEHLDYEVTLLPTQADDERTARPSQSLRCTMFRGMNGLGVAKGHQAIVCVHVIYVEHVPCACP
jgi:hypothetical protein